jgi:hypothetical protein
MKSAETLNDREIERGVWYLCFRLADKPGVNSTDRSPIPLEFV